MGERHIYTLSAKGEALVEAMPDKTEMRKVKRMTEEQAVKYLAKRRANSKEAR